MATQITFKDNNSPTVQVTALGHAESKEVCAVVSHIMLMLWAYTGAWGEWQGTTGGCIAIDVPIRHVEVLRFAFLSLHCLAQTYPKQLCVDATQSWLLIGATEVPESNVPIGELGG